MSTPTRAEHARDVLFWAAVADAAKARVARARAALEEQARAELERDGTAPTWRIPGLGTVPLSLSCDTVEIRDPHAYLSWVRERYPTEVERIEQVRPAFDKVLREAAAKRGAACDDEGTVIPGLEFRPGGDPRGVSVRPAPAAKAAAAEAAEAFLTRAGEEASAR